MTLLFDDKDRPVDLKKDPCEKCGKDSSQRTKYNSFGGYWKLICICGHVVASGRES